MNSLMIACRSIGLPVDPNVAASIPGWSDSIVLISKDGESTDVNDPLRLLAEWLFTQGYTRIRFMGREVGGVTENQIYVGSRPSR